MRILFSFIALLLFPVFRVFAHEGESEITELAEAEWAGPLIAIFVVAVAVFIGRTIRKRSSRRITNGTNAH